MTLEEAAKITNEDIAEYLGGLPEGEDALLGDGPRGPGGGHRLPPATNPKERRRRDRLRLLRRHRTGRSSGRSGRTTSPTIEEVTNYTKAGGGCGDCHDDIQAIIDEVQGDDATGRPPSKPQALTNIQKIQLIEETIEREISPALQKDGGDIELVDVDGDRVIVRLRGACASLPQSPDHAEGLRGGQAARSSLARNSVRGGGTVMKRHLPGQQRHHPGRPGGARGHAALS